MIRAAVLDDMLMEPTCLRRRRGQSDETIPSVDVEKIADWADPVCWVHVTVSRNRVLCPPPRRSTRIVTELDSGAKLEPEPEIVLIAALGVHQLSE